MDDACGRVSASGSLARRCPRSLANSRSRARVPLVQTGGQAGVHAFRRRWRYPPHSPILVRKRNHPATHSQRISRRGEFDQPTYHCDAVAVAPSKLLAIPLKSFRKALSVEHFRDGWVSHLARELRKARTQSERLILRSVRDRIVHYIETEGRDGRITLTQSKKDWAAEIGISHEALYRTLTQMVRRKELAIKGAMIALAV